jgi:hypothetical protein
VAAQFEAISDRDGEIVPKDGSAQVMNELGKAMVASNA